MKLTFPWNRSPFDDFPALESLLESTLSPIDPNQGFIDSLADRLINAPPIKANYRSPVLITDAARGVLMNFARIVSGILILLAGIRGLIILVKKIQQNSGQFAEQ